MLKLFTLALTLCAFSAFADESALTQALNTKNVVRMKLWYDGLESTPNFEQTAQVKAVKPLSEELERALNQISL